MTDNDSLEEKKRKKRLPHTEMSVWAVERIRLFFVSSFGLGCFNDRRAPLISVGLFGSGSVAVLSRIHENLLNLFVVIGRKGFVTGSEVEDLTAASLVSAAGTEYFAAGEPADEYEFIGFGNHEVFAVGFFVFEDDVFADAFCDGMTLVDNPEDFLVAGFTPLEVVGGSTHELLEDLGCVAGVENYETHAFDYASVYAVYDFIRNIAVTHMTTPEKYVGFSENFLGKTAFGIVKGSCGNFVSCRFEGTCDAHMNTVGIKRLYGFVGFFMSELIPNCDFHL